MTTERFLSKKKTTSQNLSISPYLKDLVDRYIKSEKEKNPKDERFKSVSSFYSYVMEKVLTLFQMGKGIDDLQKIPDSKIENFYDKITFKAVIPFYEQGIEMNKYITENVESVFLFLLRFKNFIFNKDGKNEIDDYAFIKIINRFREFLVSNKVSKEFNVEISENHFITEYSGYYQNIHHENSKGLAALASVLGLKTQNAIFHENYSRSILEKTNLYMSDNSAVKERKNLLHHNLKHIINYYRIVNDKVPHLWIRMSDKEDVIISFKNLKIGVEIINSIVQDIKKYATGKDFLLSILRFFKHYHWIVIESEEDLSFRFSIPNEEKSIELKILKEVLLNAKIKLIERKGLLYLE